MQANSQPVSSTQTSIHSDLAAIVAKHFGTRFAKPIAAHTQEAFDRLCEQLAQSAQFAQVAQSSATPRRIVLDSCCGTGESTLALARMFPECWVVGVDKSAHRLRAGANAQSTAQHSAQSTAQNSARNDTPTNALIVRADVIDFWRLIHEAQQHSTWRDLWQIERHCLFFPNPCPKPHQIKQRWHGHAVFPTLLALAPHLELRTNWRVYAEEFAFAAEIASAVASEIASKTSSKMSSETASELALQHIKPLLEEYRPNLADTITAFERKYTLSGHTLYRVRLGAA
jgi:tRNA (guanine-N7-)-methyltransferase